MNQSLYRTVSKKSLPDSAMEYQIEVSADTINQFRKTVIKALLPNAELPGFRKGKVPENIFVKNVGELSLLERALGEALPEIISALVESEKLPIVGRPRVTITKLAIGADAALTLIFDLLPTIALGNYKEVARKANAQKSADITVSEQEIIDVKRTIQKQLAMRDHHASHGKGPAGHDCLKEIESMAPELTDDVVKGLGPFENLASFETHLRETLILEKQAKEKDKRRIGILEKIIAEAKIPLPKSMVDNELDKMMAQFEYDLKQSGLTTETYLSHIKKTKSELRETWQSDAKKRASTELILFEIAKRENITADKTEVERETKTLLDAHKEVDAVRTRQYVESVLTNKKVFEFLESRK
jgi:FKBP-type peptidyl-prolyl cis-trans isomerase (trigger factor)